jgi:hypothetical protein
MITSSSTRLIVPLPALFGLSVKLNLSVILSTALAGPLPCGAQASPSL